MASNNNRGSGQGQVKDPQNDQRLKDNGGGSRGGQNQGNDGRGQVKDPGNDGRLKQNR